MSKIAVYTAIFGDYDGLIPQMKMSGVDYICFTDQPFQSKTWTIKRVEPAVADLSRSNRQIKMLAHRFLPDYDISVYIDGNFLVKKDLKSLISDYLCDANMAVFDHNQAQDARDCIYKEYEAILAMKDKPGKQFDVDAMQLQIERYRTEGFPENYGLISGGVLVRRHHAPDVVKAMERWWYELQNNSKRDQLSFDYVRWKENLQVNIIPGDVRNHEFFHLLGAHRRDYTGKLFRYKLKRFFRIVS